MKFRITVALGTLLATVLAGAPAQAAPTDVAHLLKQPTTAKGGNDDGTGAGTATDDGTETDDETGGDDGTTTEDPAPTDPTPPQTDPVQAVPDAPSIGAATAGDTTATVRWQAPAVAGDTPISRYEVQTTRQATGGVVGMTIIAAADATEVRVARLHNGTAYSFRVRAVNAAGPGAFSADSNVVVPSAPDAPTTPADPTPPATQPRVPGAPRLLSTLPGNRLVVLRWAAPTGDGGSPITRYRVQVLDATGSVAIGRIRETRAGAARLVVAGLTNGRAYRFRVRAVNALGTGTPSATRQAVTPRTVPARPTHLTGTRGAAGGPVTTTLRWTAPTWTGGAAVTGYRISGQRLTTEGAPVGPPTTFAVDAWTRWTTFTPARRAPAGTWYRFTVRAVNAAGAGVGRTTVSTVR